MYFGKIKIIQYNATLFLKILHTLINFQTLVFPYNDMIYDIMIQITFHLIITLQKSNLGYYFHHFPTIIHNVHFHVLLVLLNLGVDLPLPLPQPP